MSQSNRFLILALLAVACIAAPVAVQELYQWDAVSGTGSAIEDGGGTWQVGVGNWQNQTTPADDQLWVDLNNAVIGGGASGTAGVITGVGVNANTLIMKAPAAGEYTLAGTINFGNGVQGNSGGTIEGGTVNITGTVVSADGNNWHMLNNIGVGMNISGSGSFSVGGHDTTLRGITTLSDNAQLNLRGGGVFELNEGTLNIQDNAVFDVDRTVGSTADLSGAWSPGSLILGMGWSPSTGVINQDGGTANCVAPAPSDTTYSTDGPGLLLGGMIMGKDVSGTYNLNAGTLNASGIFNLNIGDPPTGPLGDGGNGQSAVFNFNGGTLAASQSDSTNPDVIANGFAHLMGNLWHANVQAGGAKIDSNGFDASINQVLEHDPALGGTPDGGLEKLGAGTLTLMLDNTYTGDTIVSAGTLEIMSDYLDDASSVSILPNAMMDLNFQGTDVVAALTLGGVVQNPGLYNAASDPTYFTGGGSLQVGVIPEPSTLLLLGMGLCSLLAYPRRRRS